MEREQTFLLNSDIPEMDIIRVYHRGRALVLSERWESHKLHRGLAVELLSRLMSITALRSARWSGHLRALMMGWRCCSDRRPLLYD